MRDMSYKVYVTDALKGIIETAGKSKVLYRWVDVLNSREIDTRTTEEVTDDIIAGLEKILGKEEDTE